MTDAIVVEGLSKRYRIFHNPQHGYQTLRETLTHGIGRKCRQLASFVFRQPISRQTNEYEDVWALKDVNFRLPAGSRLGIIGANGAGKSTLLKTLSRIVQPTTGRITIRGRISSLLEIGTGFHPELTGSENIYLNGAILGMSRREIAHKFDQIVDFSELAKFLDTPLKRYSSGMQMRLAFAVAAHLDPDILMIDEALAVGDFKFQAKCLAKLNEVGKSGRTVIFVSHDIHSVASLCDIGLFMQQGQVVMMGDIDDCLSRYLQSAQHHFTHWKGTAGNQYFQAREAQLVSTNASEQKAYFHQGESVQLKFDYTILSLPEDISVQVSILNDAGFTLASRKLDRRDPTYAQAMTVGQHQTTLRFDTGIFYEGSYQCLISVTSASGYRVIDRDICLRFQVLPVSGSCAPSTGEPGILLGNAWG